MKLKFNKLTDTGTKKVVANFFLFKLFEDADQNSESCK